MNIFLKEPWTVERCLDWEGRQEGKHEFDGSRIIEMTGGSRAHQRIVTNLVRFLEDHLDLDRFDAVPEMRIEVGGKVRYPDVTVVAGPIPEEVKTLRDALTLFEVLSDDTAKSDMEEKRDNYAQLPSIRTHVLLEQDRMAATVLERVREGWRESRVTVGDLNLPEVGVSLPLASVCRGMRIGGRM